MPVGALPDARLALEPPAVRLCDVFLARREDVEDEAAARLEMAVRRAQSRASVGVGLHVQQRTEGCEHEWKLAVDRRVAHVAVTQVELDTGERSGLACDVEHPGREVDADHIDPRGRDRHGDPSGADAELEHRPAEALRLLEVERHVFDDGHRPGVVDAGDLVVGGHVAMLCTDADDVADAL